MKGTKKKRFKKNLGKKQRIATIIAAVCLFVIVAWVVLLVSIFKEDKPEEEKKTSSSKAAKGAWHLTEEYRTDSRGVKSRVFRCEYDEKGRLSSVIYDDEKKGTYGYSYYYDEGIPITRVDYVTRKESITKEYLPDGKVRLQIKHDSSDSYSHTEVTQYDDQERPLSLTVEHESPASPYSETGTYYVYDDYGHIVSEETQETIGDKSGERILKKVSDCNADGLVTKCYEVDSNGQRGKVLLEVDYLSGGWKEQASVKSSFYGIQRVSREYELSGRIISEVYTDSGAVNVTRNYYDYSSTDRGILIKKKSYQSSEATIGEEESTLEKEFDDNGRLLYEQETALGKLQYSYSVEFDKKGRIANTTEAYLGITPVKTEFAYDAYGNLISRDNGREMYSYSYERSGVSSSQDAENAEFYSYFPEDLPGIFYWN